MKFLLILLVFFFCLIIGKLNKKKIKFSILISIAFIFTPVILTSQINNKIILNFCLSFLVLILIEIPKNKLLKNIFFILAIIFYSYSILNLSEIINTKINIDTQKVFFIDNSSFDTIQRFRQDALYLPVKLRPLIYNSFQIVLVFIGRIINYLWIDKLIEFLGFPILYLTYLSFKNKNNLKYLLFPILIVSFFVLHRDPNTSLIYLFLIPPLILFFSKNIKNINFCLLLIIALFSFLYSIL